MTDDTTPGRSPAHRLRRFGPPAIGLLVVAGLAAALWVRGRSAAREATALDHWPAVIKGRDYLQRDRPDLALQAVAHVRDEGKGAGEALAVAGLALAKMDQFRDARIALERALTIQPRQPMAAKALAAIHLSLGDTERGLARLRQAAELSPRDFRPWFTMGQVYLDLGKPQEAADVYAEAIKRNRYDVDSRLGRIDAILSVGQVDEAAREIAEALDRTPTNARLLGLASRQARDAADNDRAVDFAGRALAVDPANLDALFVRATVNHVSGRPEAARPDLERIVAINPNHLAALNLLMQVEGRLGLTGRAAETSARRRKAQDRLATMDALTQEISTRPDDPEPRFQMGLAAVEGNQRTLAVNCFQAALALKPDHDPSRRALAAIQAQAPARPPTDHR